MRIPFTKLRLKVTDDLTNTPIIDIEGNPRRIKDAMKMLDKKYNGAKK